MGWRPNYQRATAIRLAILRVIIGWSAPQTRREKPTLCDAPIGENLLTLPRGVPLTDGVREPSDYGSACRYCFVDNRLASYCVRPASHDVNTRR